MPFTMIPIRYNLRNLVARWKGTLITALTFGLVVATFVVVMSLSRGVEEALTTTGDPLNVIVMRPGAQSESQSAITPERYRIVRNFGGIAKNADGEPLAAPEVLTLVNKLRRTDGKPGNLQIRGVHPLGIAMRPMLKIVEGRMFRPGLREIIVARRVADRFKGFGLGEKQRLGRGAWTVVGIFEAAGSAFESEIWGDYQELMQEFDRIEYSTILVRAIDRAAVTALKTLVDEDRRVKLTAKDEMEYYQEQTKTAEPIKAFALFLGIIMSVGASFAGMNTMFANVSRRSREIGTLRVLGYTPGAVMASFLIESVLLAACGGVLGCLMAYPMNGIATGTTNFDSFSEIVFYFRITPGLMSEGILFAVIMGGIGGLLPAWTASRQPVLAAIRQL